MVMNISIQVRLTKAQYQQLKQLVQQRGFSSTSDYVRYMVLESDFSTQEKVAEIHRQLCGDPFRNGRDKKTRKNPLRCACRTTC